jgi:hydrogenase-4 membrane subunit HyfE
MEASEARLLVWGSALVVLAALLMGTYILRRWLGQAKGSGAKIVGFSLWAGALVLSGFAVAALAQSWATPEIYLAPGAMARWLPAVLTVLIVSVFAARLRRA